MNLLRSPSETALMPQVQKAGASTIWGALTSLFSPRNTPRCEESQQTEPEESQPSFESSQVPDSYTHATPLSRTAAASPMSQVAGPSQASPLIPETELSSGQSKTPRPPFIARDFAYAPKPPILERPIDPAWYVPLDLPRHAVPGLLERRGREWEASHQHLYRFGGNRADPPDTIPKTWGGLPKAEDEEMMRRAKARMARLDRTRKKATAMGLTPTEPNLGGGRPPLSPCTEIDDPETMVGINAYLREQEEKAKAAGHGPLIRTPTNSPPHSQHQHRRSRVSPSPHSGACTPSPRTSPRRSKRKRDELGSDREENKVAMGRRRKRRNQQQEDDNEVVPALSEQSIPARYKLRQRGSQNTTTASTSDLKTSPPKSKGKEKPRTR